MHDVFSSVCAAVAAVLSESEPVEPVLRSIWELLRTAGQPELTRLTVNRKYLRNHTRVHTILRFST